MDLIDRQAAVDAMCELMHHWFGGDPKDEVREINRELGKLPSAQPERKTGRITYTHHSEELWGQCAICLTCGCKWQIAEECGEDNFCPNCGAAMEPERILDENKNEIR